MDVLIIPADAGLVLWSVHIIYFIGKHSLVAQNQEAVSKARRADKLKIVLLSQLLIHVLSKSRTALANIDSHIEHTSTDDTHQLGL